MADHKKAAPRIRKWEGGFSDNPLDKGGATMKGVTLRTYREFYGRDKTVADLKRITDTEWDHIFKRGYWDVIKGDEIESQSIADVMADWVWMSGTRYPVRCLQRILGVADDGIVGKRTIEAINTYKDKRVLFEKILARRRQYYDNLVRSNPRQRVFLNGWLNRLSDFNWLG